MKKMASLLLVAALLAVLSACHTGSGKLPAKQAVMLTYWTFDEIYKDNMEACVERYNQTSEIKIAIQTSIYSMDELDYKLWTSLQAGIGVPDIVDLEQSRFGRYMNPKNNYLTPLNTIVDAVKQQMVVPAYDKYREKGFYYGLDYYENNCVVFYNLPLLEKVGIHPSDIHTMDEFRKAGRTIREQLGLPLLAIDYTDDLVFESLLVDRGGGYCSSQNRVSIADPLAIETLENLHDLIYVDNIAIPAPGGDFFSFSFYNCFNGGQVAAIIAPFWYAAFIQEYMQDLTGKIWVAPLPKAAERTQGARVSGIATAIPIKSEYSILIKNFLRSTRMSTFGCAEAFRNLYADPIIPATYEKENLSAIGNAKGLFYNDGAALLFQIREDAVNPMLGDAYYEIAEQIRGKVLFNVLKENVQAPADALRELVAR